MKCKACSQTVLFIDCAQTSVPTDGPPLFILLELPDRRPRGLTYNLRADTLKRLAVDGADASYKLVGVLMYKHCVHFHADVLDPCEGQWLRYDGMDEDGVGQPLPSPQGADGDYYPVLVMYHRCQVCLATSDFCTLPQRPPLPCPRLADTRSGSSEAPVASQPQPPR
jgi:hypothetical protein